MAVAECHQAGVHMHEAILLQVEVLFEVDLLHKDQDTAVAGQKGVNMAVVHQLALKIRFMLPDLVVEQQKTI